MRFVRIVTAVAMAWLLAAAFSATSMAQTPASEEEFDKLMKSVGATNGSLRKNVEAQATDAIVADAKKMAGLMKDNQAFWTARQNHEAADWAKGAMEAAMAIEKAAAAKDATAMATAAKTLGSACATCHGKNRDKSPEGNYIIKKS